MAIQRDPIAPLLTKLANARKKRDDAAAEYETLEAQVLELLADREEDTATINARGRNVRATVVSHSRTVVNDDKLRKKIGADLWAKISKRVSDTTLIGHALKSGLLSETDLAQCAEVRQGKKYIRLTIS